MYIFMFYFMFCYFGVMNKHSVPPMEPSRTILRSTQALSDVSRTKISL